MVSLRGATVNLRAIRKCGRHAWRSYVERGIEGEPDSLGLTGWRGSALPNDRSVRDGYLFAHQRDV